MEDKQLTQLQDIQLEMLNAFVKVCDKEGIQYYLGDGSLLGGVRHKGFIPWDDDIDVLMTWEEYQKFVRVGQKGLGDEYFLQTSETDANWYRVYATIRKNGTAMVQNPKVHIHQGIWLDIFIIGNARSKFEAKIQKYLIRFANYILMDHYMKVNAGEFKKMLTPAGYAAFQLYYKLPKTHRLRFRNNLLAWIAKDKHGKFYPEIWCGITDVYPAECFEKPADKVLFEGMDYAAPHNPDLYLRTQYDNDYMTPVKWEKGHENIIIDFENSYEKYLI